VLPLAVALLTAGCGEVGDTSPAAWQGSVADSAGVAVVFNPGDGVWGEGDAWRVVEDLRVGEFSGDPGYQFGQVGSIATNSSDQMLVVDRQVPAVRVFDADGAFVREIGSPGPGPGEFARGVSDVFVVDGDTVLVPDVRNRRIHRFAPDGTFIDAASIDVGRYRPLRFQWVAAARRGVVQLRPVDGPEGAADEPAGGDPEPGEPARDALRLVKADGTFGDTLLTLPAGGLLGPAGQLTYFTPEPVWALTDSLTVLYAVNDVYRVGEYDRDGVLERVITKPHESREIDDRDIRAFFEYLDRAWLAAGVRESRLPAQRDRVAFAEAFPAFYRFFVGPDETLWVQPVQPPGELSDDRIEHYDFIEDFGTREWDVFDAEGRLLGEVAMPPRFQPRLFTGDVIYGTIRDELDVQYVARMRIDRTPRNGAM